MSTFKRGDKVIMNKKGFHFYHNVDIQFDMSTVAGVVSMSDFKSAMVEALAVTGVGTVKHFNSSGDPYIRWESKMNGMYFFYEHYFDKESVTKVGLFLKLKLVIKRFLC